MTENFLIIANGTKKKSERSKTSFYKSWNCRKIKVKGVSEEKMKQKNKNFFSSLSLKYSYNPIFFLFFCFFELDLDNTFLENLFPAEAEFDEENMHEGLFQNDSQQQVNLPCIESFE